MTSLFKARAENAARVVTLQNEINSLKAKLEKLSEPSVESIEQIEALQKENAELKKLIQELKTPKPAPKKKRGPKSKQADEETSES